MPLHETLISAFIDEFQKHKNYAEKAVAQLNDDDLNFRLNNEQNSIATYMRHLAGNLTSRFTDFLTTDGEKPTRDRESEFANPPLTRNELMSRWESGWSMLFTALASLSASDLEKTVYIRKQPHTVPLALTRALAHAAYHVGQIALLAKHVKTLRNEPWNYLTIPPGGSSAFNKSKGV